MVIIILIVAFVVMGVLLLNGKAMFLIAGYNTASKEAKAQINKKALAKFMGILMFAFAFCLLLEVAEWYMPGYYFRLIGQYLIPVLALFAVIYANTGNRFKKLF